MPRFLRSSLIAALVAACSASAHAGGLACETAQPVEDGVPFAGSTVGLDPANDGLCGATGAPVAWHSYTASGDGTMTVSLCGSSFDTKLSVHTGECGALECVRSNDDFCGLQSQIADIPVSAGTIYTIKVFGFSTASGDYVLTVTEEAPPPPPAEECESALPIAPGETVEGDTTGATGSTGLGCGDTTAPSEWYVVEGTGTEFTASLCGSAFDTKISVHEGVCGDLVCVAENDDSCGLQSELTWLAKCETTYYVRVFGFGFGLNAGAYTLALSAAEPPPLTNDTCADATPVAIGSETPGATDAATFDDVGTCGTSNTAPGVWYSFVGDGRPVVVSTCGDASYDTKLSVFTGSCEALECVAGNDDSSGCGLTSRVRVETTPEVEYLVLVHGFGAATGCFTLTVDYAPPANDDCDAATPLTIGDTADGTTLGASFDGVGTCGTSNTAPGVWYSFLGNGQEVIVSTCAAADFDTKLGVFTGSCEELVCVDGNDDGDGCDLTSELAVATEAGVEYLVLVHGFQSNVGDFTLSLLGETPAPPNDLCADAIAVEVPSRTLGTNVAADGDGPLDPCGDGLGDSTVWYTFTGLGGPMVVSTCDEATDFDTKLHVFEGACEALVCLGTNDDSCGLQSEVAFESVEGVTYTVAVSGFTSATGDFALSVGAPPPENDLCADAVLLEPGTSALGSTALATLDAGLDCGGITAPGVWFTFVGTGGKTLVYTCSENTDYDTKLSIFTGECGALECFAANDDACPGFQSGIAFISEADVVYSVLVHGFLSSTGNFELTYEAEPPPANDTCEGAEPVELLPVDGDDLLLGAVVPGSTRWALDDSASEDADCGESIGGGVWYTVEGTGETMSVSTCSEGTDFDTQISVFSGLCGELVCVTTNDDDCGLQSTVEWESEAGAVYTVLVHGFGGSFGDFEATFTAELPAGGLQRPGDTNQDGGVDLSDAVALFGFLFTGSPVSLPCGAGSVDDPANVLLLDWNTDGGLDLSDGIGSLNYLFNGGPEHPLGTDCIRIAGCEDVCDTDL